MKLAIFDLDNTLIGNDSDYLWGEFLCEHNYVSQNDYQAGHDRFYQDYLRGELDIDAFLKFQLQPLTTQPLEILLSWRERYIQEKITPVMLPAAKDLIEQHRNNGHRLLIITATNRFLTQPIADSLNIEHLIACEPELIDNQYTGNYIGVPSYKEGKVIRLEQWLSEQGQTLEESWFYSDSHNDLPLLYKVDHAIAVDPDSILEKTAMENGWPVISLR